MIQVCQDEISSYPARTDFTVRLHREIKFILGRQGSFSPGICLDLLTFSFNFLS